MLWFPDRVPQRLGGAGGKVAVCDSPAATEMVSTRQAPLVPSNKFEGGVKSRVSKSSLRGDIHSGPFHRENMKQFQKIVLCCVNAYIWTKF